MQIDKDLTLKGDGSEVVLDGAKVTRHVCDLSGICCGMDSIYTAAVTLKARLTRDTATMRLRPQRHMTDERAEGPRSKGWDAVVRHMGCGRILRQGDTDPIVCHVADARVSI